MSTTKAIPTVSMERRTDTGRAARMMAEAEDTGGRVAAATTATTPAHHTAVRQIPLAQEAGAADITPTMAAPGPGPFA